MTRRPDNAGPPLGVFHKQAWTVHTQAIDYSTSDNDVVFFLYCSVEARIIAARAETMGRVTIGVFQHCMGDARS